MIIVRYADDFIIGFQHEEDARRFLDEMRERLREFALLLHPEKTRLIESDASRAGRLRRGLGKPETFDLGFYLRPRQDPLRRIPTSAEEPAGPHEGEAADDQGGAVAAHAPVHPRAGALAEAGRGRLLQLPCRADQRACPGRVPAPCHRPLAAHATASQSEGSDDVGADDATGGRVAPETKHPTSLRAIALPSHTRGGSRMRESRTCGSVRGARDETRGSLPRCAPGEAGAIQPVEDRCR